ncbi:MAG TPA: DNA recombination protein RmuC, partial [Sphingobacteriaceae bacterium]
MEWILILVCLVILVITLIIFKQNSGRHSIVNKELKEQNENLRIASGRAEEKVKLLEEEKIRLLEEVKVERNKHFELSRSNESLKSYYQSREEKIREQKEQIENLQKKLTSEFENIAEKLLKEKSIEFTEKNRINLDGLLSPLKEQIKTFEKKVEEAYDKELRDKISLREELKTLSDLNIKLSADATNLTNALKGETKTQGNWGELILETILEKSGLVKNREYFLQQSHHSEDGKRYQPDVIINLPDEKRIVIDSKVSLVDFERYFSCDDDLEKSVCLKNHIASIRRHIKGLGEKNYQSLYNLKSLDFVLLFMPVEPAFSMATQYDNTLFTDAFERNIVIVSPSTLLATLRTISSIWKYEYQNKNALRRAKEGEALYDKFHDLVKDLER